MVQAGGRKSKGIAEVAVHLFDSLNQHVVGLHPHRPTPVGIAAKQGGVGLARNITDDSFTDARDMAEVCLVGMTPGDAAHPVWRKELLFIEDPWQYLDEHRGGYQG